MKNFRRKLVVKESFPGHKGRKGQRGGSLPRKGGGGGSRKSATSGFKSGKPKTVMNALTASLGITSKPKHVSGISSVNLTKSESSNVKAFLPKMGFKRSKKAIETMGLNGKDKWTEYGNPHGGARVFLNSSGTTLETWD